MVRTCSQSSLTAPTNPGQRPRQEQIWLPHTDKQCSLIVAGAPVQAELKAEDMVKTIFVFSVSTQDPTPCRLRPAGRMLLHDMSGTSDGCLVELNACRMWLGCARSA